MLSKVFEAEFLLKNKKLAVVNTDIDVVVEWAGCFVEKDEFAEIGLHCTRVFGSFEYMDTFESFKRKTNISFEVSGTKGWVIEVVDKKTEFYRDRKIFPEKLTIDFDNKTAKIYF